MYTYIGTLHFIDIYYRPLIFGAALCTHHLLYPNAWNLTCTSLSFFLEIVLNSFVKWGKKTNIFDVNVVWHHYVQAAGIRRCFERCLFSAATFEPIQLYIICLTANQ